MKTFSGLLFISSVLLALSSVCEGGRPIRRNRSSCPVPKINHGTVRLQKRGRMVYFFCDSGFEIHGSMGVLCTSGRWKQEMPICTKAGCESPPKRQNGWVMLDAKKQTSMLFCRDGYVAAHATIAYCDGKDWDRELGFWLV
ncbi:complement factor H-like [Contarinia nasturtii]|uniref:complement factor H-like n=1 Tax=Contarinia nasturtii TaxID=265458 RepID=UPI0012D4970A|nr:complement factor H-like [Contarinia nasturtii]